MVPWLLFASNNTEKRRARTRGRRTVAHPCVSEMESGPAFAASPPPEFFPELVRWAQRGCRRTMVREPVLYGFRDAFGTASDVAKCFRKRMATRSADLSALPVDASSWVRIVSLAEFEAAAAAAVEAAEQPTFAGTPEAALPEPAASTDLAEAVREMPASQMVWQPSPLSPGFAEEGRKRLQELMAARTAALPAC